MVLNDNTTLVPEFPAWEQPPLPVPEYHVFINDERVEMYRDADGFIRPAPGTVQTSPNERRYLSALMVHSDEHVSSREHGLPCRMCEKPNYIQQASDAVQAVQDASAAALYLAEAKRRADCDPFWNYEARTWGYQVVMVVWALALLIGIILSFVGLIQ